MTDFIYRYPSLQSGRLIKRYKRFLADIELETGETITAHCANPGKMRGLSEPGYRVMVSRSDNPKRKLPYSLELVEAQDNEPTWVGVNTNLPNQAIKLALEARSLPGLGEYDSISPEVVYGRDKKSRVDFLLNKNGENPPIYVEVKNVTWAEGRKALFPDAVTTRGQKHLLELVDVVLGNQGRAVALFFIGRSDCDIFAPGDSADPEYGKLLRHAMNQGLEILPCRFELTPEGIRYLGLAKLEM
ncbi:DNA/RNA nuclease SfsA [Phormidium sp. CCY1219]|uniref:DNA/RNA nuclease SfsA n=1 Tax=Phormidium sp. CCY1219 TaxID=2886104 RepID=UPI002D1E5EA3|nr:DNA/RNA nuclease SfsA [Phormidium sp. CCY1219]MEB3828812.1 DNA/RNA nuclease SfsA [Phormidium sp. CCY1219]